MVIVFSTFLPTIMRETNEGSFASATKFSGDGRPARLLRHLARSRVRHRSQQRIVHHLLQLLPDVAREDIPVPSPRGVGPRFAAHDAAGEGGTCRNHRARRERRDQSHAEDDRSHLAQRRVQGNVAKLGVRVSPFRTKVPHRRPRWTRCRPGETFRA